MVANGLGVSIKDDMLHTRCEHLSSVSTNEDFYISHKGFFFLANSISAEFYLKALHCSNWDQMWAFKINTRVKKKINH